MTSKGRETESSAVDLYERAGFETYRPPYAKFAEQDVFGLWDILAFGHDSLIGCQVKTNRATPLAEFFRESEAYREHVGIVPHFIVLYEGEGWKLYLPSDPVDADEPGADYRVAFDGRETEPIPDAQLIEILAEVNAEP